MCMPLYIIPTVYVHVCPKYDVFSKMGLLGYFEDDLTLHRYFLKMSA